MSLDYNTATIDEMTENLNTAGSGKT